MSRQALGIVCSVLFAASYFVAAAVMLVRVLKTKGSTRR